MSDFNPKPGDWVAIKLHAKANTGVGFYILAGEERHNPLYVLTSALRPIPQPDPLTELERKVVEAAAMWRDTVDKFTVEHQPNQILLRIAVDDLLAARTPPDPVEYAKRAVSKLRQEIGVGTHESISRAFSNVDAAIAALETRKGAEK
jgi:hypothetical protein